jgi:hypothetical protein
MSMSNKLIFVSCGQLTEEEKKLGIAVKAEIDKTPGLPATISHGSRGQSLIGGRQASRVKPASRWHGNPAALATRASSEAEGASTMMHCGRLICWRLVIAAPWSSQAFRSRSKTP